MHSQNQRNKMTNSKSTK